VQWLTSQYVMNRQLAGCRTKACMTVMYHGVDIVMLSGNFVDTAAVTDNTVSK